ncbi:hypothetical protein V1527DRAFT_454953 [Lipomyces starkeyi]
MTGPKSLHTWQLGNLGATLASSSGMDMGPGSPLCSSTRGPFSVLKKLFFAFGGIKCASSKEVFFTNEAWHEAQLILWEVRQGYYSDPKDFPLYFENFLEGGVH